MPENPDAPSKKEQIVSLYLSGIEDVESLALLTESRPSYVGTVLRESGDTRSLPWHRVTGAGGRIAFPAGSRPAREQLRRLEREGVKSRGNRVIQKPSASSSRTLDALLWKL